MPDLRPLVIYHSPCLDGFTAAWAMWLKYPDAEFVPGVYGQEPPDCTDRKVYLLDFSYKLPVMKKILEHANSVIVLDHHKTAQEDLTELFDGWDDDFTIGGKFDMTKSGARLAWEWFHHDEIVPKLVLLVEDRDLGRLWSEEGPKYPETGPINAALFSYEYDFQRWNEFRAKCDDTTARFRLIAEGEAIDRKQQKDVKELVGKLRHWRNFRHYEPNSVLCANLPYTLASDAGNLLAQEVPFAAVYYQDGNGEFVFSLRSSAGGVDVSTIASRYGGGGHKNAAGFRIESLEEL